MPDSLTELAALARSYGFLAAIALPVIVVIRWHVPRAGRLIRPPKLSDIEILGAIALAFLLPGMWRATFDHAGLFRYFQISDDRERDAVAQFVGLFLWLGMILFWLQQRGAEPFGTFRSRRWLRDLAAGLLGFVLLTPITFAVYFAARALVVFFGGQPDAHPLSTTDVSTPFGVFCFVARACLIAPIFEETIFRGLLLPWARERRVRPWILTALTVVLLIWGYRHVGTVLFLIDVCVLAGLSAWGREIWRRWPSRSAFAVVSTSVLFGAMHNAVWPTPIPLTVFGLGLGILTIRRGSVLPAILVHALFNAVSVLFVLSRST